ncbi:GNAT family N-acetyltransferase [Marinomonas sp. TW1]|uniref:GNAT family N-acetyltransferase n=1 Tax=Marinomonas sp. TW1 TaxID=1561203 RepID=UPI0007AFD2C7|nr:GNAT family N-acetyltransferase [Marinomonas sp. TW1]KZN14862.1 phosphinothricin acetyltransferase [Marinomonas sp. TW1]
MIRDVSLDDAKVITEIYNYYIDHTVVSFEEAMIEPAEMTKRIQAVHDASLPWLVLEENGILLGYAYATQWKARSAYRFVVEVSVYLESTQGGKGLGTKLYDALFIKLKQMDLQAAIGCITLPNPASVYLHEKFGMEKVGHFAKVGRKFDAWHDVGYWQVML